MDFTLYRSDFAGVEVNCRYPRQQKISCAEDLKTDFSKQLWRYYFADATGRGESEGNACIYPICMDRGISRDGQGSKEKEADRLYKQDHSASAERNSAVCYGLRRPVYSFISSKCRIISVNIELH